MAFNAAVFKTRALTALLFVVVMLCGIFIHEYIFAALFFGIMLGCLWEAAKLHLFYIYKTLGVTYTYNCMLLMCSFGNITLVLLLINNALPHIFLQLPLVILSGVGIYNVVVNKQHLKSIKPPSGTNKNNLVFILFYTLLIPFSFYALISLRINYGTAIACLVIFSMWINDTMAYLVGSFIGKTPLSKISPKKTWEGTIGGVILCALIMGFGMPIIFDIKFAHYHIFIIAAICGIVGTLGDLAESKFKRLANVKDSGTFMPGHGGFLDRFDSIIFGSFFVWAYLILFL